MVPRLSSRTRDFLDQAVAQELPFSDHERARIHARVLAAAGSWGATATTSAVAGAASTAATPVGAAATVTGVGLVAKGGILLWLASGFAVGLASTTAVQLAVAPGAAVSSRAPAPTHAVSRVTMEDTPNSTTQSGAPASTERRSPAAAPPGTTRRPTPATVGRSRPLPPAPPHAEPPNPPAPPSLARELTLLEKVQSELRAGRGGEALRLLDSSGVAASSALQNERLTAEVIAACQAGELERARRAAHALLARSPGSPAAERVRASCALGGAVPAARNSVR